MTDSLSRILADSAEALVALDANGIVTRWSAGAEAIFGVSAADAVGQPIGELVGRRGDGSSERLDLALDAARLGDWSWDAKTDMVTFSKRAAEIFGIPPGPVMTWTTMRERLHPDDRERARIAVEEAALRRTRYAIEYRVIDEGRERWVSASGRARYAANGELLGMLGVVQEMTRDRLLLRVDDAVRPLVRPEDITFTAATVLGQHLVVHRCAYAFVEDDEDTFILTGNYTNGVESIVGRYRFRQFGAECLRLMRAGEPWVVTDSETEPRLEEADRVAYRATAIRSVICVPIMKSSRFAAAMAVHMKEARRWSTEEVELVQQVASRCWESIERARVERERVDLLEAAEAANRAKDEFLAMLGHELRNPLAPIVTALDIMKLRGDATTEKERTVLGRQVEHLVRLVDDLLDVSRIARGKVELKIKTLEVADVVAAAIEVASPLFEERAHSVVVDVPRTGLAVEGDASRLVQVISNLLTNAGKYTPRGGRILVSAERDGADVELRVADNGVGIAPDVLPRIFDLFVQGRQTIERAGGGLGLGLTIVKSLVERHGGTVEAKSEGAGRGTEMIVRLPCSRVASADASSPAPRRTDATAARARVETTSKKRILVVDDNVDAAEMLAHALSIEDCDVQVAHDGPAALRIVDAHAFDAAFVDIGLPVMDGYELVGRMRAHPNVASARIVAVTGYGQEADRRRALDAGFDDHLVKPVDLATLTKMIAKLDAGRTSP